MTFKRNIIIGTASFIAVTAFAGAVGLITGALNAPSEWLTHTPFTTYTVPGIMLALFVGGSATLTLLATWRKWSYAPLATLLSGIVLLAWILGEVGTIQQLSWLQFLYIILGVLLLSLSYTDSKQYYVHRSVG